MISFSFLLTDWTVRLHLNGRIDDRIDGNQFDQVNCSTAIRYENRLDNLSILYSSRAYFCAAFSVIYKEISELNRLSKVSTSCFILPEQKLEFEEVAIALGKNVDWLVKRSKKSPEDASQESSLTNNQQTTRIIGEKVWNLVSSGKRRDSKANKKLTKANLLSQFGYLPSAKDNRPHLNNENNQINNHITNHISKHIDDGPNSWLESPVNGAVARSYRNYENANSIDNLIVGQSNRRQNNRETSIASLPKRPKATSSTLGDFNTDSIQFAIEIIDSLSGKVFRSNHHSNDILQSINFQNFELQKMNNSMVYVQKKADQSSKDVQPKINQTYKRSKNKRSSSKSKLNKQSNHLPSNQTDQPFLLRLFTRTGKQFLDQFEQLKSLQKPTVETTIVEKKIGDLFKIGNESISLRSFVLVRNVNPLRAYLFNEGLVFFMQNTTQFRPRTGHWLFSHLREYLNKQQPSNNVYLNLVEVISKFLLITEFHLISDFKFLERFQFFNQRQYDPSDSQYYQSLQYEQPAHFVPAKRLNQIRESRCNLRQYQLMEIELVLTNKLEFYIVDVNLEPLMFDNRQAPYRDYGKQSKKELYAFQKNLLTSVWRLMGLMEPKKGIAKPKSPAKKVKRRRSVSLKKIKDLPAKYLDQLSRQSSKVRRKLLFVNSELNYKHKLINNWQANQFRRVLARLLVEQNVGVLGLNCLVSHKLCLTEEDLNNILLSNAELNRNGNVRFEPLYPSGQMCGLNGLVEELNNKLLSSSADLRPSLHRTGHLHLFLCRLAVQLNREGKESAGRNESMDGTDRKNDGDDDSAANDYALDEQANVDSTRQPAEASALKSDFFIEKLPEELLSKNDVLAKDTETQDAGIIGGPKPSKDYSYSTNDFAAITNDLDETQDETIETPNQLERSAHLNGSRTEDLNRNCSSNEEDLYLIDELELQPKIDLRIHSKSQTQFKTEVDYGLIKVALIIRSRHCNARIKFNQLNSPFINISLNLGIGANRIVFRIVNDRPNDQSRTYQLIIRRRSLEEVSVYDRASSEQVICQINQVIEFF